MYKELKINEIEIGPHFVTIYGSPAGHLRALAKDMEGHIRRHGKAITALQQYQLAHEPNDPNVYHPYGNPDVLGKDIYQHFHIRFGRKPTGKDISSVIKWLNAYVSVKNLKITDIESFNKTGLKYPELPPPDQYLEWIEWVRTGKWKEMKHGK